MYDLVDVLWLALLHDDQAICLFTLLNPLDALQTEKQTTVLAQQGLQTHPADAGGVSGVDVTPVRLAAVLCTVSGCGLAAALSVPAQLWGKPGLIARGPVLLGLWRVV